MLAVRGRVELVAEGDKARRLEPALENNTFSGI